MIAIGDIAARVLAFCGITKKRVQSFVGAGDCGCERRQEALNRLGYRIQSRLLLPLQWVWMKWQSLRRGQMSLRMRMAGHYLVLAARVLFLGR
jgi:hypothetical protein